MNGDLRSVTLSEALRLWHFEGDELQATIDFGSRSDPLLAGTYNGEVLCFVGFIPASKLSDVAYIWMYSTPAVENHRLIVGRWAKLLIAEARKRYPVICGHCFDSQRWLRSLGATIEPNNFFTIR
jgi:hypothetical protein